MTHVVEGRLKGAMEEADKKLALKQVAEAILQEKTLGLNVMERQATTAEKALELAEGKLGETELKLAETVNLPFAQDKELADHKNMEKAWKQTYYNKGFKEKASLVIFQAGSSGS